MQRPPSLTVTSEPSDSSYLEAESPDQAVDGGKRFVGADGVESSSFDWVTHDHTRGAGFEEVWR